MQKPLNTTELQSIAKVADYYEAALQEYLRRRITHQYADSPEGFHAFFHGVMMYLTQD